MIRFPVLDRVEVQNYALYVGRDGAPGLKHDFKPGVNVIVGINGLGKTTLLNVLLRAITGAVDVPSGEELGDKKRRLVPSDRQWFRRRVPDDAVNATVVANFHIGERTFEVKRSLANLDLLALSLDQHPLPPDRPQELEAQYRQAVMEASGLTAFDDFVFLLRYVVFFLEDRRSLVWDAAAQGDILGILFGEQVANRREYVTVFNELLSKDSEYRNMHAVVTKRRRDLAVQAATIEGGQLDQLVKQLESRSEEVVAVNTQKNELGKERDSLREQIENRRQDIHEQRAQIALDLNNFYQSFFPQVGDAGRYLLSYFESNLGCLVCGTRSKEASDRVKAKLTMNTCPVCDSLIEKDTGAAAHDPHAGEAIDERRRTIKELERQLQSMEEPLRQTEAAYAKAAAELVAATRDVASLDQQLQALGASMPGALAKREGMQNHLAAFESALNQLDVELREKGEEFRTLAAAIDQEVRTVSSRIEASFARFISGFLAEECHISYTARQAKVGQRGAGGNFPFPHFIPALTSGVNRQSTSPREQSQSVSESQKEFIDLAFRMALLEVAAPDSPAMIVLETPEASLDSVFVPRAADLLRRFATRSGGAAATRLIASSNVNREHMIPALFGAHPDPHFLEQVVDASAEPSPPTLPMAERADHVLDLLSIAAPTRALDRFRAPYEDERDRAIYPERYAGAAP